MLVMHSIATFGEYLFPPESSEAAATIRSKGRAQDYFKGRAYTGFYGVKRSCNIPLSSKGVQRITLWGGRVQDFMELSETAATIRFKGRAQDNSKGRAYTGFRELSETAVTPRSKGRRQNDFKGRAYTGLYGVQRSSRHH